MATKTKGSAVSPYSMPTLEEAYDYWVARIFPMQKGLGNIKRKPSFTTWCGKMGHEDRFEEFHRNGAVSRAKGEDKGDLIQALAEALRERGIEIDAAQLQDDLRDDEIEQAEDDEDYEEPREAAGDEARNGVMWRLNKEGLLNNALALAEEAGLDYITQEIGLEVLSSTFGPLPTRG